MSEDRSLAARLRDLSTVKSWAEADAQRVEAADEIERMRVLLTRAYGWLEDYECRSDEVRLALRALLEEIDAALDGRAG